LDLELGGEEVEWGEPLALGASNGTNMILYREARRVETASSSSMKGP
jgi:hypothetical protein